MVLCLSREFGIPVTAYDFIGKQLLVSFITARLCLISVIFLIFFITCSELAPVSTGRVVFTQINHLSDV